jgi:hypothetical protein
MWLDMIPKRLPRRMDPFAALLLVVALGMSVTVAYQLNRYHENELSSIRSAQNSPPIFGG